MQHIKVDVKTEHRHIPTVNSIPTLLQRWQRSHTLLRDDKVRALLVAVSAYTDESLASFDSGAVTCRIRFVCVPYIRRSSYEVLTRISIPAQHDACWDMRSRIHRGRVGPLLSYMARKGLVGVVSPRRDTWYVECTHLPNVAQAH